MKTRLTLLLIILQLPSFLILKANDTIPSSHPRVYVSVEDLPILREKTEAEGFHNLWENISNSDHPFMRAFTALVKGNDEMAKKAAIDFLPMLEESKDARVPFNNMQLGACIYDWCYDQMSEELKKSYIKEFKRIASSHSPYYPAKEGSASTVVGHDNEGWILSDQLPAGVAIYQEDPEMYDSAAALFFEKYVPARNFHYQSHMHHQGDSYISTRFIHDLFAAWLYKKMGVDVFSSEQQYVPYQLVYNYRPDRQQMRSGDTYDDGGNDSGGRTKPTPKKALLLGFTSWMYDDPYLWDMYKKFDVYGMSEVFVYIFKPMKEDVKPVEELPLSKYFPEPMGEMVARTGWETGVKSDDAIIHMRIGNYFFGNHQTKDFGIFQIYYKGPLAISSGLYEGSNGETYGKKHWTNYHHQTISKNGLLIFDPDEEVYKGSANDGGQRWPNEGADHPADLEYLTDPANGYKMAEVSSHEFGPDSREPVYSYISGDITPAYSQKKAAEVKRSMLTINTGNEDYPALFFVFDRVVSTKAGYKKTWLLHSIEEPEINGTLSTIVRTGSEYNGKGDYNGKLLCKTLLPENAKIEKIGGEGKEFWVEASRTNYYAEKDDPASEEGAWRIEVTPEGKSRENLFFHAMAVTAYDNGSIPEFRNIESWEAEGISLLDYGVLFNPGAVLLSNIQFTLEDDLKGIFAGGLDKGRWEVWKEGILIRSEFVSGNGNCIYLEHCPAGNYSMKKVND